MDRLGIVGTIDALEKARDQTEFASVFGDLTDIERGLVVSLLDRFDNVVGVVRDRLRTGSDLQVS